GRLFCVLEIASKNIDPPTQLVFGARHPVGHGNPLQNWFDSPRGRGALGAGRPPVVGTAAYSGPAESPESFIKKFEKNSARRLKYGRCRFARLPPTASMGRRRSFSIAASRSRSGRAPWDCCACWWNGAAPRYQKIR